MIPAAAVQARKTIEARKPNGPGDVFTIGEVTPATPTAAGSACELLAWLLGRSDGGGLSWQPEVPLPGGGRHLLTM